LLASVVGTQLLAAAIVGFGWIVAPLDWKYVAMVWLYCLVWVFIEDWAKRMLLTRMAWQEWRQQQFLEMAHGSLFEEGSCRGVDER
jgi:H+-transporting ATPase